MLSNRGSIKSNLMVIFFIAVLACIIFFIIALGRSKFFKSSNSYESELLNATQKYINDYYQDLNEGDSVVIKLSTLRSFNYIKLDNCRGYSIVTKEKKLVIEPYLLCPDYKSKNYDENNE